MSATRSTRSAVLYAFPCTRFLTRITNPAVQGTPPPLGVPRVGRGTNSKGTRLEAPWQKLVNTLPSHIPPSPLLYPTHRRTPSNPLSPPLSFTLSLSHRCFQHQFSFSPPPSHPLLPPPSPLTHTPLPLPPSHRRRQHQLSCLWPRSLSSPNTSSSHTPSLSPSHTHPLSTLSHHLTPSLVPTSFHRCRQYQFARLRSRSFSF